jgi:flagellin
LDAVSGGAGFTPADVAAELASDWDTAAPTNNREYSIGYAAVKYIDHLAQQQGGSIADLMHALEGGATLDAALTSTVGMNTAAFITDFEGVNGQNFILSLDLTDADVGGPGGGDQTATVPDYALEAMQPLEGYTVSWPAGYPEGSTRIQVGANNTSEDAIMLSGAMISSDAIDLESLDVTTQDKALEAIDHLDRAVVSVASTRAGIGATQAKLEYAITQLSVSSEQFRAAESRIRDLDAAAGMSELVRQQILRDSALGAVSLAHANNTRILPLIQFATGQQGGAESSGFALAA